MGEKTFGDNSDDIGSRKRKFDEGEQNEDEKRDAKDKEFTGSQDDGEDEYDLDKLFKDSIKKKRPTIMVKIKIEIQKVAQTMHQQKYVFVYNNENII